MMKKELDTYGMMDKAMTNYCFNIKRWQFTFSIYYGCIKVDRSIWFARDGVLDGPSVGK
jgi:hypothetical protein